MAPGRWRLATASGGARACARARRIAPPLHALASPRRSAVAHLTARAARMRCEQANGARGGGGLDGRARPQSEKPARARRGRSRPCRGRLCVAKRGQMGQHVTRRRSSVHAIAPGASVVVGDGASAVVVQFQISLASRAAPTGPSAAPAPPAMHTLAMGRPMACARVEAGVARRTRLHWTQMQPFPPLTVARRRRVAVHEPRRGG